MIRESEMEYYFVSYLASCLGEKIRYRFLGQERIIVLLAQVSQEHMHGFTAFQPAQYLAGVMIGQVPFIAANALLQIRRIRPPVQHFQIVVGL